MSTTNAFSRRAFMTGSTAVAALGLLSLAGCATPAPKPAASPTGSGSAVKTINFYGNVLGDEAQKPAWEKMVASFEKASSVTVKPVVYPSDQAATQLALLAGAGNLMGAGQAGPWQVLTPFGVLADLSDLAEGLDIPQGILDTYTIDGKLLALPQYAGGIGMIVNGTVAKSAKLKSGMTIDAFDSVLEDIKAQEAGMIPYAAVTKSDLKDIVPWMWGFGSEVVTNDLEVTIGDKASVAAVTWYKSLLDRGLIQPNVARADARVLFARGQAAIYDDAPLASTFVVTNGASQEIIDSISTISRPTDGDKESFNRAWGGGIFVTAGEGEITSREFAKSLIADVDSATTLFEQSSLAPASAKIASQIPSIQKNAFQTGFRENVTEHARGTAYDRIAVAAQIDASIAQSTAAILAGEVAVQAGLNALKTTVQDLIDSNK